MTQDEKELSEIARSIASLFGDEGLETAATVQSGGTTERHPEVGVSLGLEDALDAHTEPDLQPAPGPSSEPALVDPVPSPVESASIEIEETPEVVEESPDVKETPDVKESPDAKETPDVVETPIEAEPRLGEKRKALSEATSQYLEAPIHQREEPQRALRSAVEASRSAGAFGEIAAKVNVLILEGAGDSGVWDLANEFIDEEVLAGSICRCFSHLADGLSALTLDRARRLSVLFRSARGHRFLRGALDVRGQLPCHTQGSESVTGLTAKPLILSEPLP